VNADHPQFLNIFQISSNVTAKLNRRATRKPKPEPVPTHILYAQVRELRAMLAIAVACEDSTNNRAVNQAVQDELRVRIDWLLNEIQQRLEKL